MTPQQVFEKKVADYLKVAGGIKKLTQGFCISVTKKDRVIYQKNFGKVYRFYDLASLTKIICSTAIAIELVEQGRLDLKKAVSAYWPQYPGNARVRDLLSHQAGLEWWEPFYQLIDPKLSRPKRFEQIEKAISYQKRSRIKKSIYSDLDLFALYAVLRRITNEPLEKTFRRLKTKSIFFNIDNKSRFDKKDFAPTEIHQGQVHDENAWSLGGVAPHAGLFGSLEGVTKYLLELRQNYLKSKVVKDFVKRKMPPEDGDFGYGFMLPTYGRASCGQFFSQKSFGHTGFTGTSLWYDPQADLGVVLLSNRVYPTRQNKKFNELRPLLHDWLFEMQREIHAT